MSRPATTQTQVLKREIHRLALINAVTIENKKFFLGTDTAPHLSSDKENECGCAGIFNSTYCLSILAQIFENENSITKLENFVSLIGAKHYKLKKNKNKIKFKRLENPLVFKKELNINKNKLKIFDPGFPVFWKVI